MKVKVSKEELYECIEGAVRKALNEVINPFDDGFGGIDVNMAASYPNKAIGDAWLKKAGMHRDELQGGKPVSNQNQENIKEAWYDDDDEDDVLNRFLKDPKNDPKGGKKRMPGGGAAKKAAMKDIEDELKSQNRDDEIAAKHDVSSKPKDNDED